MVAKFLKELELREEQEPPQKNLGESSTVQTCVKYVHPRERYLINHISAMSLEEKEKSLGPARQATRYPVFKDV